MKKELPDGWEWKKLDDFADFLYGGAFESALFNEDGKGTKIIRIRNLKKGFTETYYDGEYDESYLINNGDILIGMDGEFNIVKWRGDTVLLNQRICKLIVKSNELIPDFAYRALIKILKEIEDRTAFVTVKHLSAKKLKTIKIPVPPLETQHKIVAILEKAEETKKLRAQADELTQQFLQSVFLEMFGDPMTNPKGWMIKNIGDFAEVKTGGTPSRDIEEYWLNGNIPWVKTTEIKENTIYNTKERITESAFQNSNVTLLPKNSILIAMYGQGKTRGRTAKLGIDVTTNQACAAILPSDKYITDFLWVFLKLSYDNLRNLGRGGNQPNLNLSMVKNFKTYCPPMELQQEFVEIVNNIEKTKQYQQQSSQEVDYLFNALMQKAFNGELVS